MHPGEIKVIRTLLNNPLTDQVIQQDPIVKGIKRFVKVLFCDPLKKSRTNFAVWVGDKGRLVLIENCE